MTSLTCPTCRYENVVVTCGFCLQCGIDLEPLSSTVDDNAIGSAPSALQTLAEDIASHFESVAVNEGDLWAIRVPLTNGRFQVLHLCPSKSDEETYEVFSICGPALEQNAFPLVTWNGKLHNCFFAARSVNGQLMYVLTARKSFSTLGDVIVDDSLRALADLADSVEAKICANADSF